MKAGLASGVEETSGKIAEGTVLAMNGVRDSSGIEKLAKSITEKVVGKGERIKGISNAEISKVESKALEHSSKGEFTYSPKTGDVSKMKGGGHGQANIDFLEENRLEYKIVDMYPNGVRIGNVADHKIKLKRTGTNQAWFPESWSEQDILNAGEYVGNLKENINAVDGIGSFGEVNGVRVGVIRTDGEIATVFPDATMQP